MTALDVLRGRLSLLRTALAVGDGERTTLILDSLEDAVADVGRTTVSRPLAYSWLESGIESDEEARTLRASLTSLIAWVLETRELAALVQAETKRKAA
jgi:hypothetical protein